MDSSSGYFSGESAIGSSLHCAAGGLGTRARGPARAALKHRLSPRRPGAGARISNALSNRYSKCGGLHHGFPASGEHRAQITQRRENLIVPVRALRVVGALLVLDDFLILAENVLGEPNH